MLCSGCHNGGGQRDGSGPALPSSHSGPGSRLFPLYFRKSYFALVVLSKESLSIKLVTYPMWLENFNVFISHCKTKVNFIALFSAAISCMQPACKYS